MGSSAAGAHSLFYALLPGTEIHTTVFPYQRVLGGASTPMKRRIQKTITHTLRAFAQTVYIAPLVFALLIANAPTLYVSSCSSMGSASDDACAMACCQDGEMPTACCATGHSTPDKSAKATWTAGSHDPSVAAFSNSCACESTSTFVITQLRRFHRTSHAATATFQAAGQKIPTPDWVLFHQRGPPLSL
jgi:hypothetical protein